MTDLKKLLEAFSEEELEEALQKKEDQQDQEENQIQGILDNRERYRKALSEIIKEQNRKIASNSSRYCGHCGSSIPSSAQIRKYMEEHKI